ncbi:MAG TPA: hypothetical protein VGK73_11450 [Polyangiaceae bacterium]
MAVRIRETGAVVCAALHPKLPGDQYIHDGIHYELAQHQILATEAEPAHSSHGLWWWRGEQPAWAQLEER